MESNDIHGAQIGMGYLAAMTSTPGGRSVFLSWASAHDPELWRRWAASKGRSPDDPCLVQDVVMACQSACLEGGRICLDKMAAVIETRQALEGS
jgi:hypothetical protein